MLDALTCLDDIDLQLRPDEISEVSSTPLSEEEIASFKYRPFTHQIDAINYGLAHKSWLLLDSMGLGKSLEMMYLAETLYRRGEIEHCMIICGVDSLRTNWRSEIQKFSNLSCVVLGEYVTRTGTVRYRTIKDRCTQLLEPIEEFFIIVNISTIRDDKFIEAFKKSKNKIGMICFDEAHRCVAGDTEIQTSDGIFTVEQLFGLPIADRPKVLTYNTKTKVDEFKEILDISRSEPEEALVELSVENFGEIYTLKCTESHKIYTYNRGWVKAKDLTTEDNIKISAKFNRNS